MNAQMVWDQYKEVQEWFPDLVLIPADHRYFIRGTLEFRAEFMGEEVKESFLIEIELLTTYPQSLPIVKELGGRIPASFHRFNDGSLCLGAPLALRISFSKAPTLLGFIKELVIPYLYTFSYYKTNNHEFPYGELEHGAKGIFKYYKELFQVDSDGRVLEILYRLSFNKIRGHLPCPCGSKFRARDCHGSMFIELYKYQGASEFIHDLNCCWNYVKANGEGRVI
ncbi:hypothetical protein J7E73_23955 [Paenibacillus albidus]|uniref:hypothetical protein n=1 Tax=Paenibacillus albidus TaxID=2041023 RepID=UPI001BE629CC|nr:hypothetical protein [Paenibacillus albidus]MBT2292132.1 hypothetical protein [Paenibacillus albidus]